MTDSFPRQHARTQRFTLGAPRNLTVAPDGARVAFLGLSYQESVEDGRELVERTGVTYEIGRDPAGELITAFAAVGLPTTVFIAADGTINATHTGDVRGDLDAELEELVA